MASRQHSIVSCQHSIVSCKHSLVSCRYSIVSCKHSIVSYQHSIVSCQHSIVHIETGLAEDEGGVVAHADRAPLISKGHKQFATLSFDKILDLTAVIPNLLPAEMHCGRRVEHAQVLMANWVGQDESWVLQQEFRFILGYKGDGSLLVAWHHFFFLLHTHLLSSFWTSRGHRCRPFSPPVLALNFYRIRFSNPTARRFLHHTRYTINRTL